MATSPCKRGFTLTELLVVITIIAVLASLVLPSIRLVKQFAWSVDCMSNLRQVGAAAQAYSNDWEGQIVPGLWQSPAPMYYPYYWDTRLADYCDENIGAVTEGQHRVMKGCKNYLSGGAWKQLASTDPWYASFYNMYTGYAETLYISLRAVSDPSGKGCTNVTTSGFGYLPHSQVTQSSQRPFFFDSNGYPMQYFPSISASAQNISARHPGSRMNALYFDLHVASSTTQEVSTGQCLP